MLGIFLIRWKLEAKTLHESSDHLVFEYVKADIDSMRKDLQSVDWVKQIGCLSVVQGWLVVQRSARTVTA